MRRVFKFRLIITMTCFIGSSFAMAQDWEPVPEPDLQAEWDSAAPMEDKDNFTILDASSIEQIEESILEAKLYRVLGSSVRAINGANRCGPHIDKAKQMRQSLKDLNEKYRGRADDEYFRRKIDYERINTDALTQYKTCFAQNTSSFEPLVFAGIGSYESHKGKTQELAQHYKDVGDIAAHIDFLERALEYRKNLLDNVLVGTVMSTFNLVEYRPFGSGSRWLVATKGQALHKKDEIRTGSRGRARIQFADHYAQGNAGPSVVNVGTNTHTVMEKFVFSFTNSENQGGVTMGLLKGTVRVFTENWGFQSHMKVRTGVTILGIRGTEVAITYDPVVDRAEYHLDHGSAFAVVNGVQTQLTPKTSVIVQKGVMNKARPLTPSTWVALVSQTGDQHPETLKTARAGGVITQYLGEAMSPTTTITGAEASPHEEISRVFNFIGDNYVMAVVANFNTAMMNYDRSMALEKMVDPLKAIFLRTLETKSFRQMVETNGIVTKVNNECIACWSERDERGNKIEQCTVKAKLYYANGKARQTGIFRLRNVSTGFRRDFKVYEISEATPELLSRFEQRTPNCGAPRMSYRRTGN